MDFILIFWTVTIGMTGCGVEPAHISCEGDYQCPDGYFCVPVSHMCARCAECNVYNRNKSWRSCPKEPADCGPCLYGYEEEILAGGRLRDICVKSSFNNKFESSAERMRATSGGILGEHSMLFIGMLLVLLPTMFYIYFRKYWKQGNRRLQHSPSAPCDEPPPYLSSLELTPLRIPGRQEDICGVNESIIHELNVQQKQEDTLVQAVPFRQPQYEQNLSFISNEDLTRVESEAESEQEDRHETNLQLEDESTMPSEWTPLQEDISNDLVSSEVENNNDICEPNNKRRKEEDSDGPDNNTHRSINLVINNNNNITINKFN